MQHCRVDVLPGGYCATSSEASLRRGAQTSGKGTWEEGWNAYLLWEKCLLHLQAVNLLLETAIILYFVKLWMGNENI